MFYSASVPVALQNPTLSTHGSRQDPPVRVLSCFYRALVSFFFAIKSATLSTLFLVFVTRLAIYHIFAHLILPAGLSFTSKPVEPTSDLKYPTRYDAQNRRDNFNHALPTLRDHENSFGIFESAAILCYLAERFFPNSHWLPDDLITRTRINSYFAWHSYSLRSAFIVVGAALEPGIDESGNIQENKVLKDLVLRYFAQCLRFIHSYMTFLLILFHVIPSFRLSQAKNELISDTAVHPAPFFLIWIDCSASMTTTKKKSLHANAHQILLVVRFARLSMGMKTLCGEIGLIMASFNSFRSI